MRTIVILFPLLLRLLLPCMCCRAFRLLYLNLKRPELYHLSDCRRLLCCRQDVKIHRKIHTEVVNRFISRGCTFIFSFFFFFWGGWGGGPSLSQTCRGRNSRSPFRSRQSGAVLLRSGYIDIIGERYAMTGDGSHCGSVTLSRGIRWFSLWLCHAFSVASGGSQCGSVTLPGIQWFSLWPCHASRHPVVLSVALSRFPTSGGSQCGSVTLPGIRWFSLWLCHASRHPVVLTVALSRFPASGGSQCGLVTLSGGIQWFEVWPCHTFRHPVVLSVALSRFPASGCGSATPLVRD